MEIQKAIDIEQPHIKDAIKFALTKGIPLTNDMLVMVNNTYNSIANKVISEKISDIITELETNLDYLYKQTSNKSYNKTKLYEVETELRAYVKTFRNFLIFIEYSKK